MSTGLELAVPRLDVLLDVERKLADLGLVAVLVILVGLEVDVLAVLPRAVHGVGAVADGRPEEGLEVVEGGLGHGGRGHDGADHGEVHKGLGELHLEGVLVGAGDAGELVGLAGDDVLVALDQLEVVAHDGRRVARLGAAEAVPGTLEGLGVHGLAVVEGVALLDLEGPHGAVVVAAPRLAGAGHELLLVEVVGAHGVEQLAGHHAAGHILRVEGVDRGRVGDEVGELAAALPRRGAVALLAAGERDEPGGQGAPREEGAPRHAARTCDAIHRSPLGQRGRRRPARPAGAGMRWSGGLCVKRLELYSRRRKAPMFHASTHKRRTAAPRRGGGPGTRIARRA